MVDRRRFLGTVGKVAAGGVVGSALLSMGSELHSASEAPQETQHRKPYGSGYFGEWIKDEFGLPAYHYTCDQVSDPKVIARVTKEWRSPTDQTHQVGNDRLVAAASNYGYVQVRQDEGSPKFLNDYAPELGYYGGGIGYLSDGNTMLSTYYPGNVQSFDRIFGIGYLRKKVGNRDYAVDQVILVPFGDDPLLVSAVTVTNQSKSAAQLRWVEYWGCQIYQFSFRSTMQANVAGDSKKAAALRRKFGERFVHQFRTLDGNCGLLHSVRFLGRTAEDEAAWAGVQAVLKAHPDSPLGGPFEEPKNGATMEDLNPPPTFLVSLDSAADEFSTNGKAFFGEGGVLHPSRLGTKLDGDLAASGPESALLLSRHLNLQPGESHTLYFAYGYLPGGLELNPLVEKYRKGLPNLWSRSSAAWRKDGLRLTVESEPWVERELTWHNYYLRSDSTFDDFFNEHILSQGHVYQYIFGFQGAARDPLQHVLPFVFSNPQMVKEVLRYTLKEVQPDGIIPYGIVGHGMPMPALLHPSDQEMWLLWAASEYVLATRDRAFLDEVIPTYPCAGGAAGEETVRNLLARSYRHLTGEIGTGRHGLMRLMMGDWNDNMVLGYVSPAQYSEVRQVGESVLNAAMASYVLDYYATMLRYVGDAALASDAHEKAEAQRQAVRAQWAGRWFLRAWLTPELGWVGKDQLLLEPQPWAIIGGAATSEQTRDLVQAMDELVRRPSPIGAMLQNKGTKMELSPPGSLENGGVWPSINGTLVWALALADGKMAWDEWKKNSLAGHAEAYPEVWCGIWSGPDCYNSMLSKYPGQTYFYDPQTWKGPPDPGPNWTDFPVMNMHPHAWPLYDVPKLLGVAFNEKGVKLAPTLPFHSYAFTSPLLGIKKSSRGYEGRYAPVVEGTWVVTLRLSGPDAARLKRVEVNGDKRPLVRSAEGVVTIEGKSAPGKPLRWVAGV
jgi:hypothetical protein